MGSISYGNPPSRRKTARRPRSLAWVGRYRSLFRGSRARRDSRSSDPTPVTIGGLDGEQLDLQLDPRWKRTCFWSNKLPAVPLIFRGTAIGGYNLALLPDASMRWYVLDSPDGVIVVDIEDGPGGVSHDELLQTGGEIVQSLSFS